SPVASWLFSGSAVTDAEGRFALAPVETRGVHLALSGRAIALGKSFALDELDDPGALDLVVPASSRFEVSLARAEEADAFGLEEEAGQVKPLYVEVAGAVISTGRVSLYGGRSGVVLAEEGEVTLVLYTGDEVVRRARVVCPPGGLHTLRP